MRFEIEASPTGGLRIIDEIPYVGPICQIEGRNGVGKSVALRLLELCSGAQPYDADQHSWATLKSQLGAMVVVRALGLVGDQSIEWRLNPSMWPDRPEPVGAWLGTVTIDDQQASLEEAHGLIRIIHHSGDLTLEGTIRQRIGRDRNAVRGLLDRFTDREREIGERLDELRRDLDRADLKDLRALQSALDDARVWVAEAAQAVEAVRSQHASTQRALSLREQQQRLVDDVPVLEARERQLDAEIQEARDRVSQVEARYDELRSQRRRDEAVVQEIETIEKLLKTRTKRAENARERAAHLAAQTRLPADANQVATELASSREGRERLVYELDLIDATPRIRQLADELSARLATARAQELEEQVIARIQKAPVTVGELRKGVKVRRAEISDYQPEPPAAALEEEIRNLEFRVASLSALEESLRKVESTQRLVKQAQEQLTSLTSQLPAKEAAEYREIEEELSSVRSQHLTLVERRAVIRGQMTEIVGGGAGEGARELADLLGVLGVDASDLDALSAERGLELERSLGEQAKAASALTEAHRRWQLARAEFDQAIAILEGGDDHGWLRTDELMLPHSTLTDEENGHRLRQLEKAAQALQQGIDSARETLRGIDGGLRAWQELDRFGERGGAFAVGVRKHYERVFGREFSSPAIVNAIFDDGEFGSLDLDSMVVTWKTDKGELRARPLAAFSSGERAFAYTRTRLQSIERRAKNTVVALDEFGAFLARDRFEQLLTFLKDEVLGPIADEVIIVLPLSRDYEAELQDTHGKLHDEFVTRVDELNARGYFVRSPDLSMV